MTHHKIPREAQQRYLREGWIGLGWNEIGDPSQFSSPAEIGEAVRRTGNPNWPFAGKQIWRFLHEMARGDLVILSGGGRSAVMRVTGDWYFVPDQDVRDSYANRRPAELIDLEPHDLWRLAGGLAEGDSIRWTLVRAKKGVRV